MSDSTPVFHRGEAAQPAWDCDLIQFRQRINHTEVLIVILKNLRRCFECVTTHFRLALTGDYADLRRADSRFNDIELAGNENIQITRHWRSRREAHFFSAGHWFLAFYGHVRYGQPILRHHCAQLKTRTKRRLVPAGEKPASIGCFKLGSEHDFSNPTALLLITHVEQALTLPVHLPLKSQR